jgi:ligand-binding sensor domain-containing protein
MIKSTINFLRYFVQLLITAGCLHSLSFGQYPVYKSFDIRSENTKPRILKLFVDHNGLIWTGTDKGIFTFDGISFTKIPGTDSIENSVSAFFEDRTFNLWAGYENGRIIRIKNQKINSSTLKTPLSKSAISAIAGDGSRIYFSTHGEGVYCLENELVKNISSSNGLSDDYCYDMVILPDNRICIATDAGLNFVTYQDGIKKIEMLGTSEGLPDDIVKALDIDKNNILWIGMQENGIVRYDLNSKKLLPFSGHDYWIYGQINNILCVDDLLYIATDDKGIIIADKEDHYSLLHLEGDRNIKTNDLIIDQENNLWIAESIHLYRTSGNKIELIKSIGNKQLKFIHCITCDKNGGLWFSPDQQLGYINYDEKGRQIYKEYKILDGQFDIVSLYFDPYGFLWIGTMGSGVYRFNPINGHVRKVTETTNVESSSILSINGKGNEVWIAGFNSVMKLSITKNGDSENALIERLNEFNDSRLLSDYVYTIFIDSKERLWFGTDANGIYNYDGVNLKNISIPENAVHSFTEDKNGRIWFSTADAGLGYIDSDNKIFKFQTKDGLSDPSPTSLICDKSGNIIVVHSNGFDVLNPETKNIIYHSSEENLADLNCDLNSITMTPDNNIWMGTEQGILFYKPASDLKIERPKIVIQSVSLFLDKIDPAMKKVFRSDENNLRFDYDGLWYIDPQRINYYYMLEGYSNKWELTKDHTVSFPKLPTGKFVFRIKSSLNNSIGNSDEASFSFEILPPLWQRWWFRILSAGLVALIIVFIIKRREEGLRKFERLQKEKIEFQFETLKSQVNPHFLFNSFNTLLSVIENTPKNAVKYVEKLSEFFRNIITYRDKNVITIEEELNILGNYLFIQKERYGENLQVEINVDKDSQIKYCIAPMTLQLLAENAIKHNAVSRETPLKISITNDEKRLIVSNNINLKITPEKSAGFGLQNIKSRYALLSNDKLEIFKDERKFVVYIPLIRLKNEYFNR